MTLADWNRLSIKQRLTLSYLVFILVPVCLLSVHSYDQTRTYQKEQTVGNLQQTLSVLKNGIESKLNLVESISHNITYNTRLQSFLDEPFEIENGSMDLYIQVINPIVYYGLQYNQVEISAIKVYMNNHSIPEGFGNFYHDTAVANEAWYQSFIESDQRSRWIAVPEENSYAFLQKIVTMEGEFLGITSVTILRQDLLASLEESPAGGPDIYVADADGRIQFGQPPKALASVLGQKRPVDEEFEQGGRLYVQDRIVPLGFTVGLTERLPRSLGSYQLLSTAGFIAAMILSILLFYQVLKKTFIKIKASIRAMDHSIRTGFAEMIPVERNDEIGVISEKFNTLLVQINALVGDMIKRETIHKDTQLRALQAQINPHFIYNTINLFSAKTELAGLYDVSEAFADFGRMLRYNMNDQLDYASVQQEIDHVRSYLQLQKLKYGERLQWKWSCAPALLSCRMIRFLLQPVVENSIAHGMRNRQQLLITLDVNVNEREQMTITVSDDGAGMPAARTEELNRFFRHLEDAKPPAPASEAGMGIGLANILERLRLHYGNAVAMRMESVQDRFTRTVITVPIREGGR